jgi:hypothetical protein
LKVAVSKRAFLVFKSMFPGRDIDERTKSVNWDSFVNAMSEGEVGFAAQQAAGRAAFIF